VLLTRSFQFCTRQALLPRTSLTSTSRLAFALLRTTTRYTAIQHPSRLFKPWLAKISLHPRRPRRPKARPPTHSLGYASLSELLSIHQREAITQHDMAGKKRAAPKSGHAKKVRYQRSPDSVMRYADSNAINRNRSHSQRLPTSSFNPLDLAHCIALFWTLPSSLRAC